MWYVGWRIDRKPPERIFEIGQTPEKAFYRMTHSGFISEKIHKKIYGPYKTRKEAETVQIPLPEAD